MLARNCLEYLDVYAAAETYGYVVAPLNFRLTREELAGIVAGLDPHALLYQEAFADVAPDAPLRLDRSGTTPSRRGSDPLREVEGSTSST